MKVYKFKCLGCKETSQVENAKALFKEGCPLCYSKQIEVIEYGQEE